MGKRPKKKIVLFLVEGKSEQNALQVIIPKLYAQVDESIEVLSAMEEREDGDNPGGDITSMFGVTPENIERKIDELFFHPFFLETGLYPKDISEVIHLVDTDGAYIDDSHIRQDESLPEHKIVYKDDGIYTLNADSIVKRNIRKRANLNHLILLESIKARSKTIPYSVYYFSSNLDHYIHNDANLDDREKISRAQDYSISCSENIPYFVRSFLNDQCAARDMTYQDSWNFIREGMNSVQRHTNVNLLIEKIISGSQGAFT